MGWRLSVTKGDAMAVVGSTCDPGSEDESRKRLAAMDRMTGQVDLMIRQGVNFCWMMLPPEGRTAEHLQKQVQRIVDRALKDHQDDIKAFKQIE
jgi:hypothetical protein